MVTRMSLREAAQAALDALEQIQGGCTDHDDGTVEAITVWCPEVIADLRAALDAEPAQAVAWMPISVQWPFADLDILFSDGSVVMSVIPQSDGDFWWRGGGAGERFFDPVYSEVTHWRLHDDSPLYTAPQPPADVPLMTDEDFVKIAFPYLDGALMEGVEMDGYALLEILRAVEAEVRRRCGVVG